MLDLLNVLIFHFPVHLENCLLSNLILGGARQSLFIFFHLIISNLVFSSLNDWKVGFMVVHMRQ